MTDEELQAKADRELADGKWLTEVRAFPKMMFGWPDVAEIISLSIKANEKLPFVRKGDFPMDPDSETSRPGSASAWEAIQEIIHAD